MQKFAKKGRVRLYLEVRLDLPFSLDEPMPIAEVVRKVASISDFCELVKSGKVEFAEAVHAISVDIGETPGEYDTVTYETTEEISDIIYGDIHKTM